MTPLDLLYSWQSLFLAVVIATMTQSFKHLVESLIERYSGGDGRAKRKASIANVTLFPMFPLILGGVIGRFFPIRPEYLVRYVNENHTSLAVYAMWGASIGQFSDYLYQRSKAFLPLPILWKDEVTPATAPAPKAPKPAKKSRKKGRGRAKPTQPKPTEPNPTELKAEEQVPAQVPNQPSS